MKDSVELESVQRLINKDIGMTIGKVTNMLSNILLTNTFADTDVL